MPLDRGGPHRAAWRGRARGEGRPALHVGEEEDPLAVRVEAVVVDPGVERLGEDAARAGRPVEEGEEEAVRLVAGGPLHPESDRPAVGRVLRRAVEGRVLRGEVLRRLQLLGRPVHRDDEDVDVRREGRVRVAVRREGELLAVGRDVEVGAAADARRRGSRSRPASGRREGPSRRRGPSGGRASASRPPRRPSGARRGCRRGPPSSSPSPSPRPSSGCSRGRRRTRARRRRRGGGASRRA